MSKPDEKTISTTADWDELVAEWGEPDYGNEVDRYAYQASDRTWPPRITRYEAEKAVRDQNAKARHRSAYNNGMESCRGCGAHPTSEFEGTCLHCGRVRPNLIALVNRRREDIEEAADTAFDETMREYNR